MKNKATLFLGIAILAVALVACKKDDDENENFKVYEFFKQNGVPTQTFVVNATLGDTILTAKGAIITFAPNSFETQAGQLVTGNVVVTVREVYDKTDMLLSNTATTSNGNLIVSRGELLIKATQNNIELVAADYYRLMLPTTDNASVNPTLFYGQEIPVASSFPNGPVTGANLNWQPVDSSSFSYEEYLGFDYYSTYLIEFGWINCDYFYDNPNPLDSITAVLPEEYNRTNTAVFLSVDGENSIANLYEVATNNFRFWNIPVGTQVHLVTLSFKDDKYFFAVAPATIAQNTTVNITPVQTTQSQIAIAFDDLP